MQNTSYGGNNPRAVHIEPKQITTHSIQKTEVVSTTAKKVLSANENRNGFSIRNQGDTTSPPQALWWGFTTDVVVGTAGGAANKGQLLQEYDTLTSMMDCGNWLGDIYMIADGSLGDSTVSVLEW